MGISCDRCSHCKLEWCEVKEKSVHKIISDISKCFEDKKDVIHFDKNKNMLVDKIDSIEGQCLCTYRGKNIGVLYFRKKINKSFRVNRLWRRIYE